MDDPKHININEDSTYLLIKESLQRGINCFYNDPSWVQADLKSKTVVKSKITKLNLDCNDKLIYSKKLLSSRNLEFFDAIFIRQDPPFNMNYISNTYLLEKLQNPIIINNPTEIRNNPEKHIMMNFPKLTPPTLISSNIESLIEFINNQKIIVLKPAYGNGGLGIVKLTYKQKNLKKYLQNYFHKFSKNPVIAQKFLKNFNKGDKRIILINGAIKGSVLRIPKKNSIKANFHAGGRAVKTSLTIKEKFICNQIKKFLIQKKLYFVGIDVIDGYLTEVNITSPTGIHEINRLDGLRLEKHIINFVLKSLK